MRSDMELIRQTSADWDTAESWGNDSSHEPDPPTLDLTWYSMFCSLPPELQVIVTKHVDRNILLVLCLVNKHFYQLSIPEIYSRVDLFCYSVSSSWCGTALWSARHRVKMRQYQFCSAIEAHPELGAMIKVLIWKRHKRIWDALALMPGLRYIRLEGIRNISSPRTDVRVERRCTLQGPERFPWSVLSCLETISASGSYVAGGLSGILVNSPRLTSLSLTGGAREAPSDGEEYLASIVPVLDACISLPQGLLNLRSLELERCEHADGYWTGPEAPAVQAWCRFLSRFGGQLEHLTLRLDEYQSRRPDSAFKSNLFPLFTAETFMALKSLTLKGFNLSVDEENIMRRKLPLVVITKIPEETARR